MNRAESWKNGYFSYYTKPWRKSNILINVCIVCIDLTGHIDYNNEVWDTSTDNAKEESIDGMSEDSTERAIKNRKIEI